MTKKCCLKKVRNVKVLSICLAAILAFAVALGVILGSKGYGVWNTSKYLKDANTLTISLSNYAYSSQLDELEDYCEDIFEEKGVSYAYVMKGEMGGADSEVVYVFADDVVLDEVQKAVQDKFDNLKEGAWNGALVKVAANDVEVVNSVAQGYILRGIIAAVVIAVLVFAYAFFRHNLNMAITAGVSTALGTALTAALTIITRIPATVSVAYIIAAGGLLTAIVTAMTLSKLRANESKEYKTAESYVANSIAVKEILLLTATLGGALVLVGAVATPIVRWFALLALLAVLAAAFIGLIYVPALYLPFKKAADSSPAKDGYIGAQKTSTKIKKIFTKKAKVVETPAEEEAVEETPAEEATEEAPVEEATEEVVEVEEVAEETPAEDAVEVEEAPAEEAEVEEPSKKETNE